MKRRAIGMFMAVMMLGMAGNAGGVPVLAAEAESLVPEYPQLKGNFLSGSYTAREYNPGVVYKYDIYVSEHYKEDEPAALVLMYDYLNKVECAAMETLVAEGKAPAFVAVGLPDGMLLSALDPEKGRWLRMEFMDVNGDFDDMVVEELIPHIIKTEGLAISDDPNLHMVAGGSATGEAAIITAWQRNDYFRRCYAASPAGDADLIKYMAICEPRPIRTVVTVSQFDNEGAGYSMHEAVMGYARAWDVNGYEYRWQDYEMQLHTYGMGIYEEQLKICNYLWENWDTEPVAVGQSASVNRFVKEGSAWEEIDPSRLPEAERAKAANGVYEAEGGAIYYVTEDGRELAADGFEEITSLNVSSDMLFLYVTDRNMRNTVAFAIGENGSLTNRHRLDGKLFLTSGATQAGPSDMYCGASDVLYYATEWGVQIGSWGSVNAVLPLPGDLPADRIEMEGNTLYVMSGDKCYQREMNTEAKAAGEATEVRSGSSSGDWGEIIASVSAEVEGMSVEERVEYFVGNGNCQLHPMMDEDHRLQ